MPREPGREKKKEVMKDIILKLHEGLPVEEAKERFLREVGNVSSTEIAEIEQELIDEGLSPEEIRKFCNVHALLFESALAAGASGVESPAHPVYLFKQENREIEKILKELKRLASIGASSGVEQFKAQALAQLEKLHGVEVHYRRKEQVLFPFLEKHGFFGPSKVMWGKDDEIRDLMKKARSALNALSNTSAVEGLVKSNLNPLIDEVEGMIFKEESILFPTSLEKLTVEEWAEVLSESEDAGYVFIQKPAETEVLTKNLLKSYTVEPAVREKEKIVFPTGSFTLRELLHALNTLPVDITFIDADDRVAYYSEGKERLFLRTKSVLGRTVQNCHPPRSVDAVNRILESFKKGTRDSADFWITLQGKFVLIRYFAVRENGRYLGTLEMTQDVTGIRKLEGEKRLLDETW